MKPPDRSISYSISCNGHVMGEFEIDRIAELMACGEFKESDLYYAEGMADWDVLASLKKEVMRLVPRSHVDTSPRLALGGCYGGLARMARSGRNSKSQLREVYADSCRGPLFFR